MTGLPQGWAAPALEEVCEFNPKHDGDLDQNQLVSFVPMPAVSEHSGAIEGATDRPLSEIWKGYTHFADGDVIFAKITPCMENGKAAVARSLTNGIACGSTEFHVLRTKGAVLADYVWRFMRQDSFRRDAEAHMTGAVGQRRVPKPYLERHQIPLPPLAEQRRIVRKLDTLSARSTTARTHLTAIEKLVERMRGAVLSQALNGRLMASQIDCGESVELGRFITGIEQGWSPKCDNAQEIDPTKWAVLTTTAIQAITFDSTENKRLPESLSPRPHLEVEVGDVLMTRAGPRVRCAVCCYVAETAPRRIFSDKAYRIRLDQSVEPEFFVMMMNAPEMVRALDAIKSGGSESGLNLTQDRLKSLAINIWDRPTQVEVIADVKRQFAKIDRLAAEASKALKLLGHLEGRILAKAFAGDLVAQDPADEPAETLLARIVEARAAEPKGRKRRATAVKHNEHSE